MYTVKQFLYNHQEVFSTIINQEVLDEVALLVDNNVQKLELEIDTGSTAKALAFVDNNIDKIGKILSINHFRNIDKVTYITEILGDKGKLKINGGISSGYVGTGPRGFIRLLTSLGIDKDTAVHYIYGNTSNTHSFEVPFNAISQTQNASASNSNDPVCPICGSNNWNGIRCMTCGNMYDD